MKEKVEPNALLLQVMAHDLLSPLTAVKWQIELLRRPRLDARKQAEYLESIADSTSLGIALTKHAHVAASVLLGTYKRTDEVASLSNVLRTAAHDLTLQYERHGLTLAVDIADGGVDEHVDRELSSLLVWAIAKFFLTCAPAHTTVTFSGRTGKSDTAGQTYVLSVQAPDIPGGAEYATLFGAHDAQDAYDQTYVFAQLIHATAPLLNVSLSARADDTMLAIESTFSRAS